MTKSENAIIVLTDGIKEAKNGYKKEKTEDYLGMIKLFKYCIEEIKKAEKLQEENAKLKQALAECAGY